MMAELPKGRLRVLRASRPLEEPKGQPTDPLAVAILYNSHSFLFRLAEELLLDIMECLDPVSIFCLRRTSRTFLCLFSSRSFKKLHDRAGFVELGPWAAQKLPTGKNWSEMARLLGKDAYCDPCQARSVQGTFPNMQYMHCSACRVDHPATLFSRAQRNENRKKRVCVGYEGHVRLCEHKTLRLSELSRRRPSALPKSVCRHKSHLPEHHDERTTPEVLGGVYPMQEIRVRVAGPNQVMLWHTSHLDLSEHGEEAITAEAFRAHIQELRKGPAGYIVPEYAPGILPELRAFDPTRCGCLVYPGLQAHHGACEKHVVSRSLYSREINGENRIEIWFASCGLGRRCLRVTHTRKIHFGSGMRRMLSADVTQRVRGVPCDHWWKLTRDADVSAGIVSYDWYGALEPASYGLTRDRETYGMSWCDNPQCANYHGYLGERAIRGQRINVVCREGCERVKKFFKVPGKCRGFMVPAKRNGGFALSRRGVWPGEELRPGLAVSDIEEPRFCTIL